METHYTMQEQTILQAIPSFHGDRNCLPKDVILAAAKDFCNHFRQSVQAFNESNRDERFKPCMSQYKYADDVYRMIEAHHTKSLFHDKDNFYQVLFAVSCLMGVADHRRSWWEETFAKSTADYLDSTNNFHGAKQQIQAIVHKIDSMLQYELSFEAFDDEQQTEQQTQKLQQQAEQMDELQELFLQKQAEEQQRAQQPNAKRQHRIKRIAPRHIYINVNDGGQLSFGDLFGDMNIQTVEHMDVHSPQPKPQPQQSTDRNRRAVLAVHQQCACAPAEWAVVVKLLEEQGAIQKSAYLNAAAYINEICGQEVTSARAIARSIIYTKIIGQYPDWRIKDDEQSRKTPNILRKFMNIAQVFIKAQSV